MSNMDSRRKMWRKVARVILMAVDSFHRNGVEKPTMTTIFDNSKA